MTRNRTRFASFALAGVMVVGVAATTAAAQDGPQTPPPPPSSELPPPSGQGGPGGPGSTAPHDGPTATPPLATAPTAPAAPKGPDTTAARPGGVEVVGFLEGLIARVEASSIDATVKTDLLARLREAKASFVAGRIVANATMQALIADVRAALGLPTGTDGPKKRPEPTTGSTEPSTDASEPAHPEHHGLDAAEIARILARATVKVNTSTLADADKKALLDAIAAVQAKLDAGTAVTRDDLDALAKTLRDALGHAEPAPAPGDATPPPAGATPRDRALAALDRQIAKVQASTDLTDAEKATIVAALEAAKAKITAAPDAAPDIKQQIDARRAERLAELSAKLGRIADAVTAYADKAAATPGVDPAVVTDARAKIADARDQLALATTATELRAVWKLLREARIELHDAMAPPAPAPAPTAATVPAETTVATDPATTAAPN